MKHASSLGALVGATILALGAASAVAGTNAQTATVSYPTDVAPHRAPVFASVLGAPSGGTCDRLAKRTGVDPDVIMIATNRNGEALCVLDDVETVPNRK